MREFEIQKNDADQRVDKFIAKTFHKLPKSLMYKYIRNKKIKVNRKRCEISQRLQVGDIMQLYIAEEFFEQEHNVSFLNISSDLNILYEDKHLLIVDKDKGLLAHSDIDDIQDNLIDRVKHYLYDKKEYDPNTELSFSPSLCHRIDRNTQGIVIAAKSAAALREVNALIQRRMIEKKYICIVEGIVEKDNDSIILYHQKQEGNHAVIIDRPEEGYKEIQTVYKVLDRGRKHTLLEIDLLTGKSHQIRAVMAHLHHPLLGDQKYGAKRSNYQYQVLSAYRIMFRIDDERSILNYMDKKVFELKNSDLCDVFYKQYK